MKSRKHKVAVVIGTRPEAIKLFPVIKALKNFKNLNPVIISTGQQREMLESILSRFGIVADYEMDLMAHNQSLFGLTSKAIKAFEKILEEIKPSFMLVQGDTTTAFLGALGAFYAKIPVGHVEAGLRTRNKFSPFPEEINRRLISTISDLHFCPTQGNKENLIHEGVLRKAIYNTGNTGIDTLLWTVKQNIPFPLPELNLKTKRLILLTIHRRESFGKPMREIFRAIRSLAQDYSDLEIIYPVHLNPNVQAPAYKFLKDISNIHLVKPMGYFDFVQLMKRSHLILTDSGGIQEEAPTLGIPTLVLRKDTERPEALGKGVMLIGTKYKDIFRNVSKLLDNESERVKLCSPSRIYGDGKSAIRIAKIVNSFLHSKVAI